MYYNKKRIENENTCRECGVDFSDSTSLHRHFKAHKLFMGDYYVKHFPKKSLLTGNQIPFKNKKQYFSDFFCSDKEESTWLNTADKDLVKKYIKYKYSLEMKSKSLSVMPFYNYAKSLDHLPDFDCTKSAFGSHHAFCKEMGVKSFYSKPLPSIFWTEDPYDMEFMIDTREQIPFSYKNSFRTKIEVGDYTVSGEDYDYTYVDRKNIGDFLQTLSGKNYERFKKEMDRCRGLNSKIFVVVEARIEDLESHKNKIGKQKAPIQYILKNMREMQLEYKDVCQFIFCKNRDQAQDVTARILKFSRQIWDCDLQYYVNLK